MRGASPSKLPIFERRNQSQGANASGNSLEPSQMALSQLSAADVPSLRLPVSICHPSPDHRNCAPLSMFPASAAGPMGRVWVAPTQRANRDGCDGSFEPATPVIQAAKRRPCGSPWHNGSQHDVERTVRRHAHVFVPGVMDHSSSASHQQQSHKDQSRV
ncbi:hypothetical protein BT67DRAFT_146128 [Trichocladium antarcticum]|uniref:Uncharacterized protein n=1 Tax=Trichocladium antarcticum TaxID=1450529 RepID=A0AAN6UFC4_9PEZI|nr:hypothetical protein BT67DRAFT_146128 [Trichocladium antarcticum]